MVENILAKVAYEKVFEAVVVVITDADALSPAAVYEPRCCGDVGESAVAIILEQMRMWFLAFRKTFQAPAIHQKNVQPAVVVIIIKSDSAARGLKQKLIFVFAAKDRFCVEPGFFGDVHEVDAERWRGRRCWRLLRRH